MAVLVCASMRATASSQLISERSRTSTRARLRLKRSRCWIRETSRSGSGCSPKVISLGVACGIETCSFLRHLQTFCKCSCAPVRTDVETAAQSTSRAETVCRRRERQTCEKQQLLSTQNMAPDLGHNAARVTQFPSTFRFAHSSVRPISGFQDAAGGRNCEK